MASAKALRHNAPGSGLSRRRDQILQTLGPQAIGDGERPVEPPQVAGGAEGGHFVHDDIRLGAGHRFDDRGAVQRIRDRRLGPDATYRGVFGGRASEAHHGMTTRYEPGQEAASHGAGGACHEDPHDLARLT
jgi:hypothetical protein